MKKHVLMIIFVGGLMAQLQAQWNTITSSYLGGSGKFTRTSSDIGRVGVGFFTGGIATSDPAAKLHVSNFLTDHHAQTDGFLFRTDGISQFTNKWQLFTGTSTSTVTEKFQLFVPAGSSHISLQSTAGDLLFHTTPAERMRILVTGEVGINTSTPTSRLDINGNLRIRTIPNNNALTQVLVVDGSGNVHYRDASTIGGGVIAENGTSTDASGNVEWGNLYGLPAATAKLMDDREIPMNDKNIYFTDGPSPIGNKVTIGNGSWGSKLNVINVDQEQAAILGYMHNASMPVDRPAAIMGIYKGGLSIHSSTPWYPNTNAAIFGRSAIDNGLYTNAYCYGTKGLVESTSTDRANIIGAMGEVHTNDATAAYGVFGSCSGNNVINYGVYGEASGAPTNWAGYFVGDVMAAAYYTFSDSRLKKDIIPLDNAVKIITSLNPKIYSFRTSEFPKMHLPEGKQFGLISQEVEEIFPQFVKKVPQPAILDENGNMISEATEFKSLNYEEFIPLLIAAVKEQQADIENQSMIQNDLTNLIENQQKQIDELKLLVQSLTDNSQESANHSQQVTLNDMHAVILNQNAPNPFAERTTINYVIPLEAVSAQILFYNQMGELIQKVDLTEKGNGQLNVYASDLSSGIYTYTLIVDGRSVDTKRMVCSK